MMTQDIHTITFGTIYMYVHLVDRRVVMSRVSALEDVAHVGLNKTSQMKALRQILRKVNQDVATVPLQQSLWCRFSPPKVWIRQTAFLRMATFKI